jgi:hypothetical protein
MSKKEDVLLKKSKSRSIGKKVKIVNSGKSEEKLD